MMNGWIDERARPLTKITVVDNRGEILITAILDTGFEGYLCLPIATAVFLGLELKGTTKTMLADETIRSDEPVFAGKIL
ncbi:MAG: hypothetical protein ACE5K2_05915 [Candidatus Zixiibacteriota bacterium]